MVYKTLIISVLIILLASNESFSELKNDFWISIDNSELKYAQVNGGLLLKNNCDYEIKEIEVQTYPSASNSMTRIFGLGSYYFKVGALKQGESVKADWNKFSNTEGKRLKIDEYSFNRISISSRKDSGKNELLDEHFPCDPNFTVENRGFNIRIKNICGHPIRVAVHYKNTQGSWVTNSWWAFEPNESGNLSNDGQSILTGDSILYYYAETTDNSNIVWKGDKSFNYIGLKKYGMRKYEDFDGDTYFELNCSNSQLPVHGERYTNSLGMEFVYIAAGTFMMGNPSSEDSRENHGTQHRVTLTKGYWIQTTEVTQAQWQAVMGSNPSHFKGNDLPVETVTWNDAQAFINKLNQRGDKLTYSLPTEAQWVYAAGAGSNSRFCFGDSESQLANYAWYSINSDSKTHPVGQKSPNAWGLYDMHGNVDEWCQDRSANKTFSLRVSCGGTWCRPAGFCELSASSGRFPGYSDDDCGFRLACPQVYELESR